MKDSRTPIVLIASFLAPVVQTAQETFERCDTGSCLQPPATPAIADHDPSGPESAPAERASAAVAGGTYVRTEGITVTPA